MHTDSIVPNTDRGLEENDFTNIEDPTSLQLDPSNDTSLSGDDASIEQSHLLPEDFSVPALGPESVGRGSDTPYEMSTSDMFPLDGSAAFAKVDSVQEQMARYLKSPKSRIQAVLLFAGLRWANTSHWPDSYIIATAIHPVLFLAQLGIEKRLAPAVKQVLKTVERTLGMSKAPIAHHIREESDIQKERHRISVIWSDSTAGDS
ncbi:hypothetical protein F4781DRAFT_430275 [Annulohypoxylon bovei var. microspora]|nr:hypothetical protein F4781DRAFT_430275 [Annulohypoxylon bovei var. microspora]